MNALVIAGLFIAGITAGLILSVVYYPRWEIHKLYRVFVKEGFEIGKFKHITDTADHNFRDIVKPNCETLYSVSFVKPEGRSFNLSIPAVVGYFSTAFLDDYGNILAYLTNCDVSENGDTNIELGKSNPDNPENARRVYLDCKLCWIIVRYDVDQKDLISKLKLVEN